MIPIGSDHAGYPLKEALKKMLDVRGVEYIDMGTYSTDSVDYPDFAVKVAMKVEDGTYDRGILVCGSGEGVCITANRYPHVRAALVWRPEIAITSRTHNDANILCLPGRFMDDVTAEEVLDIFLNTPFEGGRHTQRVRKMTNVHTASKA